MRIACTGVAYTRHTAFRAPHAEKILLFDLMPVVAVGNRERLLRVMSCLHQINALAKDLGGMCYPVGGLRYTPRDWKEHFGSQWDVLVALKQRYDPEMILGPGPGIFQGRDPG